MKQLLLVSLALMTTLTITACNNNNDRNENSQQKPSGDTSQQDVSESSRELVKFPENYDKGVNYTTVNRGNVREELYTSRETIEAVQNGQPIPSGTVITLEIYRDDELSEIFVMEKRTGWADQNPPEMRNGDWLYQEFNGDKSVDYEEDIGRCYSCHANQERDNFLNTLDEMMDYDLEKLTGSRDIKTESGFVGMPKGDWEIKEVAKYLDYPQGVHDEGKVEMMSDKEKDGIIQKVLMTIFFYQYKN
jgi:hypothetical protein